MKQGKLTANGVILEKHEMRTVVFLLGLGFDIELVPKSNREGAKSPDMKMDGMFWEMKAPKGEGKWLMKKTMQRASHQAENIVMDLRRVKIHEARCRAEIERYFGLSKRIKRVKMITKTKKVVDFVK